MMIIVVMIVATPGIRQHCQTMRSFAGHERNQAEAMRLFLKRLRHRAHVDEDAVDLDQIEHKTYLPDELSVRFHHRLVSIHPFPNGNGRHARLMADLLVMRLGGARFSWGRANLQSAGDVRRRYIAALKAADNHDIGPLRAFARS